MVFAIESKYRGAVVTFTNGATDCVRQITDNNQFHIYHLICFFYENLNLFYSIVDLLDFIII